MLVAIAVSAVGWLSYRNLEQALLPRVLDRIESHSQLIAAELQSYARGARADVAGFRASAAARGMVLARLNGGMDPVDHLTEATWRERLLTRLVAELEAKPAYSKFRLIGVEDGQREIVRVDRYGPNGAIRVVPDAELQQKADRPLRRRHAETAAGRSLRLADRPEPGQRRHRDAACADVAGCDARSLGPTANRSEYS